MLSDGGRVVHCLNPLGLPWAYVPGELSMILGKKNSGHAIPTPMLPVTFRIYPQIYHIVADTYYEASPTSSFLTSFTLLWSCGTSSCFQQSKQALGSSFFKRAPSNKANMSTSHSFSNTIFFMALIPCEIDLPVSCSLILPLRRSGHVSRDLSPLVTVR